MTCDHGVARLIIGTLNEDGSAITRAWTVPGCLAENLAAQLGEPHMETVASAQGVADVWRAMQGVPGIVRTQREGS